MRKSSTKERINVIFPEEVLKDLRQLVPAKQRSDLIVQATAEKLALLHQQHVVRKTAGAWQKENHTELQDDRDFNRWMGHIRTSCW